VLSALAGFEVLNSNVNSFGDDSVTNGFVDLNTDGSGCNVPNSSSFTVVIFMRHTLVDGGVGSDINIISDFVGG
jgi:hypothetical protein